MRTLILLLLVTLSASPYAAEKDKVYKWVDKDGVVHYSSEPPAQGAQPAKLPPLQTYKGGTVPNLSKFEKPRADGASSYAQIQIVAPARDETFRGGERVVPVGVMVTPSLAPSQKLIYMLDGVPASQPTTDTSFALTNVERGTHTVTVSLVDESGNELGSSNAVTFHMKPPTAEPARKPPKPAGR